MHTAAEAALPHPARSPISFVPQTIQEESIVLAASSSSSDVLLASDSELMRTSLSLFQRSQ